MNENSILCITPYDHKGQWVFDDPEVGLVREPFVSGADVIIDKMVEQLENPADGFTLLFSTQPFPLHDTKVDLFPGFYYMALPYRASSF